MGRIVAAIGLAAALALPAPASADLLVAADGLWWISDDGASRTPVPGGGQDPAWALDGQRFAVAANLGADRTRLEVGRLDSPARTAVPGSDGLREPSWSPDGLTLAASREVRPARDDEDATPRSELVLVPAGGGEPRVLTSGAYDVSPAWSPAGGEIAFSRVVFDTRRGTVERTLMAIRPDGSGLRRIAGDGGDPAWSPDGQRIAFSSVRDRNGETCFHDCTPNGEIYVVGAGGGDERRLTASPADDSEPAWSPDGARIAFASDRHYPAGRFPEVFAMDADGSCVTQLTFGSDAPRSPAWRPGALPVGRGPCGVRLAPYYDGVDLGRVRVRRAVPLYAGRGFEGMLLTHAEGNLIVYDECDRPDPARCLGEIQLQTYTTCRRNPARLDEPGRAVFRVRGALAIRYGDGYELLSGGTTTAVWGIRSRRTFERFVAALRPVRGPERLGRRLPAPRLPSKAWRSLRRSKAVRRTPFGGSRARLVRFDRRVLRALRSFGPRRRPACER
ncbi:MAG TPA: hypothetical protein VGW75_08415 [Solirubrobacteraceae bacterium]|nr:hypothetical protein [Solirubrobacteraceae bacterium]